MELYAPGKLLISGEYIVLKGATAFAIPTKKYGQYLTINKNKNFNHNWQSFDTKGKWFEADFSFDLDKIIHTTNIKTAKLLLDILKYIQTKNTKIFQKPLNFTTKLEFYRNFGLGSSSTLMILLGKWSKINPFELNNKFFNGSGYDIAVGIENKPILYHLDKNKKPNWKFVNINYTFKKNLWFIYLNKKQSSREAIKNFKNKTIDKYLINRISEIGEQFTNTKEIEQFNILIDEHEQIISKILNVLTIKKSLFHDFKGSIKSLGAWGGDFILVTGEEKYVKEYFNSKGFDIILNWKDFE